MAQLRVRALAEEKGIGMKKLARLADISEITARKIWRPDDFPSYYPTIPILERIASVLGVHVADLFVRTPDTDDPPSV